MATMWPGIVLNGAVVALLWGLLWRGQHQRVEQLQAALERRVERDFCRLRHGDLQEVLLEMKRGLERMERTMEEVRIRLARESGKAEAEHDHEKN